jgi:hypothetical protein
MTSVIAFLLDNFVSSLSTIARQFWSHFGDPRSQLEGRNADFTMYSTFLTVSPGSVLFSRFNLLKREDLCFSCLRLGLVSHRRNSRSSHLCFKCFPWFCRVTLESTRPHLGVRFVTSSLSASLYSPFFKCPWSIIDLFRILRIFIISYVRQFQYRLLISILFKCVLWSNESTQKAMQIMQITACIQRF